MNQQEWEQGFDNSGDAFTAEERINLKLWRFTAAPDRIQVFFSCRHTGVSAPPYDTLNIGFFVEDDTGNVHKNRQLLGRALGHKASCISSPRQRHSAEVGVLTSELDIGAGSHMNVSNPFDPCDAMVTTLQSAPLLLQFADCVPVVFCGAVDDRQIVAIAHAGRLSLMAGIVGNTVETMTGLGADPGSLMVALGPAVKPCCYQVDEATATEFRDRFGDGGLDVDRIDLKYGVANDLADSGVNAKQIHNLDICTCCDEDFFSHRRDGPRTGRQGAIAWID